MRLFSVGILFLSACGSAPKFGGSKGSSNGPETPPPLQPAPENNQHSMAVADISELPACDAKGEGWLVYIKADKKFQVCSGGSWSDADITGAAGADGKDGKDGKDGSDNHIFASLLCGGQLDGTSTYVDYNVVQTTANDVFATACVRSSSLGICKSTYYASQQAGAQTAAVILEDDLLGAANAGYWTVSADRSTSIVSVDYKDSDAAGGEMTWSMTADKCQLNKY